MRTIQIARARMPVAAVAAVAAVGLVLPGGSSAAQVQPRVTTGAAAHVLAPSAELTGVINPEGVATSYYFQYGTSTAYGLQTAVASAGSGTSQVKVGQPIDGLHEGIAYHYRLVASNEGGSTAFGLDRSFTPTAGKPKIELAKVGQVVVGTPFLLTGTLTGLGNTGRMVVLQASPYPYTAGFANIGAPAVTNASGRFAFRVANLLSSTEFRVLTVAPSPLYSPLIVVGAALRVMLQEHTSRTGIARLYGTVSPAAVGAPVYFQLERPARPGTRAAEEEPAPRFVTQFTSIVRRGTRTTSRFSAIVRLHHAGRYRAYVRIRSGKLVSGYSVRTVFLRAAKGSR